MTSTLLDWASITHITPGVFWRALYNEQEVVLRLRPTQPPSANGDRAEKRVFEVRKGSLLRYRVLGEVEAPLELVSIYEKMEEGFIEEGIRLYKECGCRK